MKIISHLAAASVLAWTVSIASVGAEPLPQLSSAPTHTASILNETSWFHGAENCDTAQSPAFQSYQYDDATYIIRQNKCDTYEAPFMYLLRGDNTILLVDTGAATDKAHSVLIEFITSLLEPQELLDKNLLVVHSHSHSDHTAADKAFAALANTTVIGTKNKKVKAFMKAEKGADDVKTLDLGGRKLSMFLTPGHQEESIVIYDAKTQWLLTGDTLYPGLIMVKDWSDYRDSINKIHAFISNHPVSAIMGAHIEMKKSAGEFYEIGSTFQPNETALDLPISVVAEIRMAINAKKKPKEIVLDSIIIQPMNGLVKGISSVVRWFKN